MLMSCSYTNPWRLNGEIFESDHIQDNFGFVYHIHCIPTNRDYIGRKYFWSFRKPKGKSRKVKAESDWKCYYGSCPELKEDVEKYGKENFTRTILSLHKTKGKTNFEETRQLFAHNVLTESLDSGVPRYYNSNILNRYFRKDYYGNND
ncbi:MAG: NAD synthetase [Candidatus Nanopelagicaceae bacterium]